MADAEHLAEAPARRARFYSRWKKGPPTVEFHYCSFGKLRWHREAEVPSQMVKYKEQAGWYELKVGDRVFFSQRGRDEEDPQGVDEQGLHELPKILLRRAKETYKKALKRGKANKPARSPAARSAQAQASVDVQLSAGGALQGYEGFDVEEILSMLRSSTTSASRDHSPHPMAVDERASMELEAEESASLTVNAVASPHPAEYLRLAGRCLTADDPQMLTHARAAAICAPSAHAQPSGRDKTGVVFDLRDELGILAIALLIFKKHGVNLVDIHFKAPIHFYLVLTGHAHDANLEQALLELQHLAGPVEVLEPPLLL